MKEITIALVQMEAPFGEVDENIEKMYKFTREASEKGADIICFPELCVHGYRREEISRIAEPVPGKSSHAVSNMAVGTGVTVLAGIAEDAGLEKPYNTHLVAYTDGKVQEYRKTHLGKSEQDFFLAADNFPVYSIQQANFGIEICWEIHFPEISTILSLNGVEVIFVPHASPTVVGDRKKIWLKYLPARAYDNSVFVAACNLIGRGGENQEFCGGAMVLDPKGNLVAEAFNGREELLVTRLDPAMINRIRRQESGSMRHSFFLESRRPELYKEILK